MTWSDDRLRQEVMCSAQVYNDGRNDVGGLVCKTEIKQIKQRQRRKEREEKAAVTADSFQ